MAPCEFYGITTLYDFARRAVVFHFLAFYPLLV